MQQKTFLLSFFLMLPTLFMGQILQEISPERGKGLPDPDQYPFEVYIKLGPPPFQAVNFLPGYQNMHEILEKGGVEFSPFREMNVFEVGVRYKRFYAEIGNASGSSSLAPSPNDRFSFNSTSKMVSADLGYAVWQDRNSALLLRFGIGHMSTTYDIRPLQNLNSVDFDGLFTEGAGNSSILINHMNAFLDISVECWLGRPKNSPYNFGEAFRVGYRRGINETPWEALNTTSLNAPLDRMGEFYINMTFHLGASFPSKSK